MKGIVSVFGEVGEGRSPIIDENLADYNAKYMMTCLGCKTRLEIPLNGTFRNQIYEDPDMGASREIAGLFLDPLLKLIQCIECNALYTLSLPEPIFERTEHGDIELNPTPVPKLKQEYDIKNMEKDVAKSVSQIKPGLVGWPTQA
jgi:hypothetical protein